MVARSPRPRSSPPPRRTSALQPRGGASAGAGSRRITGSAGRCLSPLHQHAADVDVEPHERAKVEGVDVDLDVARVERHESGRAALLHHPLHLEHLARTQPLRVEPKVQPHLRRHDRRARRVGDGTVERALVAARRRVLRRLKGGLSVPKLCLREVAALADGLCDPRVGAVEAERVGPYELDVGLHRLRRRVLAPVELLEDGAQVHRLRDDGRVVRQVERHVVHRHAERLRARVRLQAAQEGPQL
mmetsp:Transcript_23807/g.70786  ORF Transcript_23807/g.70786 Transcript_23807/m.70786 type:complete len:245 (-) Transcript_23807:95-829(-)